MKSKIEIKIDEIIGLLLKQKKNKYQRGRGKYGYNKRNYYYNQKIDFAINILKQLRDG